MKISATITALATPGRVREGVIDFKGDRNTMIIRAAGP
jgi:hypothetical protein